jgi:hypothetical protein
MVDLILGGLLYLGKAILSNKLCLETFVKYNCGQIIFGAIDETENVDPTVSTKDIYLDY